jgi:hypothetical protein
MSPANIQGNGMDRRLRIAGLVVLLGLLIQLVSLRWAHPLAFLLFAFLGGPVVLVGIGVFLYSLVSVRPPQP